MTPARLLATTAAAALLVLGANSAAAQNVVQCESRDYQYAVCPTGRIAGAQLVRQISQAACIEGSTWGTLRDGIWVDRGCEGEFEIYSR